MLKKMLLFSESQICHVFTLRLPVFERFCFPTINEFKQALLRGLFRSDLRDRYSSELNPSKT